MQSTMSSVSTVQPRAQQNGMEQLNVPYIHNVCTVLCGIDWHSYPQMNGFTTKVFFWSVPSKSTLESINLPPTHYIDDRADKAVLLSALLNNRCTQHSAQCAHSHCVCMKHSAVEFRFVKRLAKLSTQQTCMIDCIDRFSRACSI